MRLPVKYVKEGDNLNHYIDRLFFSLSLIPHLVNHVVVQTA